MTYALVIINPPDQGAAFGAAVVTPLRLRGAVFGTAHAQLRKMVATTGLLNRDEADALAHEIDRVRTSEAVSHPSGIVVRLIPQDENGDLPHACPCCGALVLPSKDDAFSGHEDSYCSGCYTWGDPDKISCDPNHTAHPNPWTTGPAGACFCMEVVTDQGDETGHDVRYSRTDSFDGMWDETENALVAWPGLTADRILSVTITKIQKG